MKSPVYGTGRNYNSPKRSHNGAGQAGSVKMKGKKVKHMSCGCCVCLDKREELDRKRLKKEAEDH